MNRLQYFATEENMLLKPLVLKIHNPYAMKRKQKIQQPCKSKHAYINENGKWICACGKKLES